MILLKDCSVNDGIIKIPLGLGGERSICLPREFFGYSNKTKFASTKSSLVEMPQGQQALLPVDYHQFAGLRLLEKEDPRNRQTEK